MGHGICEVMTLLQPNIWEEQVIQELDATHKAYISWCMERWKWQVEARSLTCVQSSGPRWTISLMVQATQVVWSIISKLMVWGFSKEKDITLKACPCAFFTMSKHKQVQCRIIMVEGGSLSRAQIVNSRYVEVDTKSKYPTHAQNKAKNVCAW